MDGILTFERCYPIFAAEKRQAGNNWVTIREALLALEIAASGKLAEVAGFGAASH